MSYTDRLNAAQDREVDAIVAEAIDPLRVEITKAAELAAVRAAEIARLQETIVQLQVEIERLTAPAEPLPDGLWFRPPADLRSRERKSFPHHFGPFPPTLDNRPRDESYYRRVWMTLGGEGGKHDAYGGYVRNAPIAPVPFGPDPVVGRGWDYRMQAAEWELKAAAAAGHDGFMVDLLGASGADSWDRYIRLRDVAIWLNLNDPVFKAQPFYIIPMLDTNGGTAKTGDMVLCADRISQFFGRASTWTVDGRPVFSSFKVEGLTPDQWKTILAELAKRGHQALFLSSALDFGQSSRYAEVTWGEGSWGFGGDPGAIRGATNQVAQSRSRGKKHMLPINSQNVRPNTTYGKIYEEAGNTEAMRESWAKALREQTDYVQEVTFSDFGEGAEIVPSEARGWCPLDLEAWYLTQWKTGQVPTIERDAVILSHRSTPVAAKPTGPQTTVMTQRDRPGRIAARDTVEALTFLTAPAQVTITTAAGSTTYDAPAGEFAKLVPLAVGPAPKVEIRRAGKVVAAVESTVSVRAATRIDDRQYYWFSSLRDTAGQRIPFPNP